MDVSGSRLERLHAVDEDKRKAPSDDEEENDEEQDQEQESAAHGDTQDKNNLLKKYQYRSHACPIQWVSQNELLYINMYIPHWKLSTQNF